MSKIKCASTLFTGAELNYLPQEHWHLLHFLSPSLSLLLNVFPYFFPFHWFFLQVLLFVQVGEVNIHCCLLQTDIVVYWISTVCMSVFGVGVMVVGVPGGDYNHNKTCAQHTWMHTFSVPVSLSLPLSLTHTHTHTLSCMVNITKQFILHEPLDISSWNNRWSIISKKQI